MFRFGNPEYLYLLLLIPTLAFLHLLFTIQKRRAIKKFGNPDLLSHLMPELSAYRPVVKFYLLLVVVMAIVFVLAAPQFGTRLQTVEREGIEIIFALDVSNSMNAQDVKPSRLEVAKQAVTRLTNRMENDRIGMVVFAFQAFTQLPITADQASVNMFLSNISSETVQTQGTDIGSAINLAANSFSNTEDVSRAIVLISDGENHEGDPVGAARAAAEMGIKVYTMAIGTSAGGPIPLEGAGNFLRDRDGNVVITRLNDQLLSEIAIAGGGIQIPANNVRDGVNNLVNELSGLEETGFETKIYTDFEEQFQYVALLALFLLILEYIILERKNRLLKKIDLFTIDDNKVEK